MKMSYNWLLIDQPNHSSHLLFLLFRFLFELFLLGLFGLERLLSPSFRLLPPLQLVVVQVLLGSHGLGPHHQNGAAFLLWRVLVEGPRLHVPPVKPSRVPAQLTEFAQLIGSRTIRGFRPRCPPGGLGPPPAGSWPFPGPLPRCIRGFSGRGRFAALWGWPRTPPPLWWTSSLAPSCLLRANQFTFKPTARKWRCWLPMRSRRLRSWPSKCPLSLYPLQVFWSSVAAPPLTAASTGLGTSFLAPGCLWGSSALVNLPSYPHPLPGLCCAPMSRSFRKSRASPAGPAPPFGCRPAPFSAAPPCCAFPAPPRWNWAPAAPLWS